MASVGAVVLAAGGSTRLGEAKQLLTYPEGETLVHSVVRAARETGCESVCVVTGRAHEEVTQAVADLSPVIVRNENWRRGIGSSIRLGLGQLFNSCTGVVLLASDQPALEASIIRALIEKHEETGRPIIASDYADTIGIPAFFHRSIFSELLQLPLESGAKHLIQTDLARVATIAFPGGAIDIDSPEDLQAWRSARRAQPATR